MAREAMTALRRAWTTGACAAAAARAAFTAMLTCRFPDPVSIRLPRGGTASFPLAMAKRGKARACVGVIKDAGDDPDITNGALITAETERAPSGSGIAFAAGLSLAVGEPTINPAPRAIIRDMLIAVATDHGASSPDVTVTISIPDGQRLAKKTMNARLGIIGARSSGRPVLSLPIPVFPGFIRSSAGSMSPGPPVSSGSRPPPASPPSAPCSAFTVFPTTL
jgi:cobalt-precorrin-5B (C1)-methyltransferase